MVLTLEKRCPRIKHLFERVADAATDPSRSLTEICQTPLVECDP